MPDKNYGILSREEKQFLLAISFMEFRLTYDGELPSSATSDGVRLIKHQIRQYLHPQLKDLWARDPGLGMIMQNIRNPDYAKGFPNIVPYGNIPKKQGNFEFIPLVSDALKIVCHLDLLFMRNDPPGSLITKPKDIYGGDLDNRLKIFLDALRYPKEPNEITNIEPKSDEHPFFCLLEDDSLITRFAVESDTLLGGAITESSKHVRLIAKITIRPIYVTLDNLPLIS